MASLQASKKVRHKLTDIVRPAVSRHRLYNNIKKGKAYLISSAAASMGKRPLKNLSKWPAHTLTCRRCLSRVMIVLLIPGGPEVSDELFSGLNKACTDFAIACSSASKPAPVVHEIWYVSMGMEIVVAEAEVAVGNCVFGVTLL